VGEPGSSQHAASPEVLVASGIHKSFGTTRVLEGFDLRLREGENLAILGRSGSGKSVFLKIVTGLLIPDAGTVQLWGRHIEDLHEDEWVPYRRRMGMVFQAGALFDSMSVYENVAFPLRERQVQPEAEVRRIVAERLEWVGLPGTEGLSPSELSGGMRRRVALARTLAGEPQFVLYDEPTSGLDPVTGRRIARLMRDLDRKLRSTSILVTHDIECALTMSSRWAFLSGGRVLADGRPEDLLASHDEEIREFLLSVGPARKSHASSREP
jgi:phospholipid/cholesterol/gamma-HCH transport system ATP-binding protein